LRLELRNRRERKGKREERERERDERDGKRRISRELEAQKQ
jgi:hypothetical protein